MKYKGLINLLKTLRYVEDSHESHPEESTLHHTVQSFVRARKESNDPEFWVACLFHDIGKVIETLGHEKIGVDILQSFGYYNERVIYLIENHMRIRWFLSGRITKRGKIEKILGHPWLPELIHIRRIDGLAREVGKVPVIDEVLINDLLIETEKIRYTI